MKMKIGIIAGSFDVIHPGYIYMFEFIKENCDFLIVALPKDPSIDRSEKLKPILSVSEREKILSSLIFVDKVITYQTEIELESILKSNIINVRFLGDDYINKNYTGKYLNIPVIFINRDHGWSTTKFKNKIAESLWK